MPRGDKSAYTDKQIRQADHIAESYEDRGIGHEEAESRAWVTVNKQDGGGKKSGSGRRASSQTTEQRTQAAKKGWETRRRNSAD